MKKQVPAALSWIVIAIAVIVIAVVGYFVLREPPRPGPDDRPNPPAPPGAPVPAPPTG
ncbi:MAG: hypothetical protein HRF45_10095 [Fimbriimonadia bacterium]